MTSASSRDFTISQPTPSAPKPMRHHSDSHLVRSLSEAELSEPSPATSSGSETDDTRVPSSRKNLHLQRPKMPSRKSSGTIIVPRDDPNIEVLEEEYEEGDARTMSPRRTSEEVDRLEESARQALIQQAKTLQESLLSIVDRVESVKSEHEKLEGGNRFLQSYIGELMQTSKLTASSSKKGKVRSTK